MGGYDGQGKTREQETADSVAALGLAILVVMVVLLVVGVLGILFATSVL